MKKLTSYLIVGLTFTATLCTSCTESGSNYAKGNAKYACDESFRPVIDEELDVFSHRYPEAKLDTIYTNEADAIKKLMDGEVYLVITSRNFTPQEREYLEAKGTNPGAFKIGYDGLTLIQNTQNTDSCISVNDIKRILLGEVKNWSDIYPNSKLGKIQLVFDNPKASTVHFAEDSILGGKAISKENATAVNKPADVVAFVEKNKNAIGIIGSNWLNDKRDSTNLTFKKEVRPMYVSSAQKANIGNSYQPFQYYFYSGEYPLVRTVYALVSDPRRGVATTFKNFIISQNQGQLIILKAGLLPAYGEITLREVHVK